MTTTITHVRSCNPQSMVDFASNLTTQNNAFTARVEQMARDVDGAMTGWKGSGAAAASTRAVAERLSANHLGTAVTAIAGHYTSYGPDLTRTRSSLLRVVNTEIPAAGMKVDDAGNVKAPRVPISGGTLDPTTAAVMQQRLDKQASYFQARVKELLTQFHDTETKAAQAITASLADLGKYEKHPDGPPIRPSVQAILDGKAQLPTDPKQLHDFWKTLTPAEKDALYARDPFIGNRNGIPQVDRDHYNRRTLGDLRAEAQRHLNNVVANKPTDVGEPGYAKRLAEWHKAVEAARKKLAGYDAVANGLKETLGGPPRLLSMLDNRGHGAIAIRNPDTAGNVATYVPGITSDLTKIDQGVLRADRLRLEAEQADPSKQTSVIAWYGYDTPPGKIAALDGKYADAAAKPLADYQAGLRVTHEGDRSTNTVVGHSYGGTAIGHAASGSHTMDADRVALAGSLGMGVDKPSDLHLTGVKPEDNAKHIWVTTNKHDPIKVLVPNFAHGPQPWGTPGFGQHFHSTGPAGWALGWSQEAHSSYFDDGNPGLDNMGKIIAGGTPSN